MRIVTVSGTDLFHLAALYLGDASQWFRIAEANGNLKETYITGIQDIRIPGKITGGAGDGLPFDELR